MKIEGGFWQNFKAAGGLGLGGGLGAGFGWRVGQWLAELFIRAIKWIAFLLIGVAGSWYAGWSQQPRTPDEVKARQEQRAAAREEIRIKHPEIYKSLRDREKRRAAEQAASAEEQ